MNHFCTYFDSNYLVRFLSMYRSLRQHGPDGLVLFALCFDDAAFSALRGMALEGVRPISLEEFERTDKDLLAIKGGRSRIEYYFTCSPSLLLYVLEHFD